VGIEASLEPRADSSVGSGDERESTTSAQVRRVGGECKLKASVTEKYVLKTLYLFLCSEKSLGIFFNHRNTFRLQVRKDTVGISSTAIGRYRGWPSRCFQF